MKQKIGLVYSSQNGHITKWTQHIGFLTLAGMERVVEWNRE